MTQTVTPCPLFHDQIPTVEEVQDFLDGIDGDQDTGNRAKEVVECLFAILLSKDRLSEVARHMVHTMCHYQDMRKAVYDIMVEILAMPFCIRFDFMYDPGEATYMEDDLAKPAGGNARATAANAAAGASNPKKKRKSVKISAGDGKVVTPAKDKAVVDMHSTPYINSLYWLLNSKFSIKCGKEENWLSKQELMLITYLTQMYKPGVVFDTKLSNMGNYTVLSWFEVSGPVP